MGNKKSKAIQKKDMPKEIIKATDKILFPEKKEKGKEKNKPINYPCNYYYYK